MIDVSDWLIAKNPNFRAAFVAADEGLAACAGQGDVDAFMNPAQQTLDVWAAADALPDAAMLILRAPGRQSIASRKGGVVIEGTEKLNAGLVRSSLKALPPVTAAIPQTQTPLFDDAYQATLWNIFTRLATAAMPRAMTFAIGGLTGVLRVTDGRVAFFGDYDAPATFAAEVKAAVDVNDAVNYTLSDLDTVADDDAPSFAVTEILSLAPPDADQTALKMAADGWPVQVPADTEPFDILIRTGITARFSRWAAGQKGASCAVLSENNQPLFSATVADDGTISVS